MDALSYFVMLLKDALRVFGAGMSGARSAYAASQAAHHVDSACVAPLSYEEVPHEEYDFSTDIAMRGHVGNVYMSHSS